MARTISRSASEARIDACPGCRGSRRNDSQKVSMGTPPCPLPASYFIYAIIQQAVYGRDAEESRKTRCSPVVGYRLLDIHLHSFMM
jgi:hypothetical protein